MLCCVVLSVLSSFAIMLLGMRADCFTLITFCWHVPVGLSCLFLVVLWVGL